MNPLRSRIRLPHVPAANTSIQPVRNSWAAHVRGYAIPAAQNLEVPVPSAHERPRIHGASLAKSRSRNAFGIPPRMISPSNHSSNPPSSHVITEREARITVGRVQRLVNVLRYYLEAQRPNPTAARLRFDKHMGHFRGTARTMAYERVVKLFLSKRMYSDAQAIAEQAKVDGRLLSPSLTVQLAALKAFRTSGSQSELLSSIGKLMDHSTFDERMLRSLLSFAASFYKGEMGSGQTGGTSDGTKPGAILDLIADHFARESQRRLGAPRRGLVFHLSETTICLLIRLQWELMERELAEGTLMAEVDADTRATSPHAAFISHMRELASEADDVREVIDASDVLQLVADHSLDVTLELFNTMIAREVRDRRYAQAFQLFEVLQRSGHRPDACTYGSIWSALKHASHLLQANTGYGRYHRRGQLSRLPSPRQLFARMLTDHNHVTGGRMPTISTVLNTGVLNAALRTFCVANDFAGAYVVLRSFRACNVTLDSDTWRAVFTPLAARAMAQLGSIQRQLQLGFRVPGDETGEERTPEDTWLRRFFGPGVDAWTRLKLQSIQEIANEQLLRLIARPLLPLDLEDSEVVPVSPTPSPGYVPPELAQHGFTAVSPDLVARSASASTPQTCPRYYSEFLSVGANMQYHAPRGGTIPSLLVLLRKEPAPKLVKKWAQAPLERILLRAMVAGTSPAKLSREDRQRLRVEVRMDTIMGRSPPDVDTYAILRERRHAVLVKRENKKIAEIMHETKEEMVPKFRTPRALRGRTSGIDRRHRARFPLTAVDKDS